MKLAFYCQYDKRVNEDYFLLNYPMTNEYVKLTYELKQDEYEVHTLDVYKKQNIHPDICIFLDIPILSINKIIDKQKTKAIAILREAELINKINYNKNRHDEFDVILTWKNSLVDSQKYFFFPSTRFVKEQKIEVENFIDRKLCVLVNSNLSSKLKGELYSHRLKAIKWFEKNHLNDFDLYGYEWDKLKIQFKNRTIIKSKFLAPKRLSYKGTVDNKLLTMSKYKFTICFENTNNVEDYITEKIFDCFLAGTVPIYWGATNIEKIIPENCFVDFRQFSSFEDMYTFVSNMSNKKYLEYINNINLYIDSNIAYKYSLENWVYSIKKVLKRLLDV